MYALNTISILRRMGSPDFTNRTLYGEQTDGLRYVWTVWLVIMLFPSLFGNTTILVASLKYRAIKLHRVIVMFVEHIAMLDLALAISCLIPKTASLIANQWFLGRGLCYYVVMATYYGHAAKLMYIAAITTCKWVLLSYPLKAKAWFRKRASLFLGVFILILSTGLPISFLVVDREDVSFDYRTYICAYGYTSDIWQWLQIVLSVVLGFIPMIIIVIMSALLVSHLLKAKQSAARSRGSFRWQGLITVQMTAALYILSYLPFISYMVVDALTEQSDLRLRTSFYPLYHRLAKESMWLSVMYNVFIYAFTVKSFRDYLKGEVRQRLSTVSFPGTKYPAKSIFNIKNVIYCPYPSPFYCVSFKET